MRNLGNRKINPHVKARYYSEIAPNIAFSEFNFYEIIIFFLTLKIAVNAKLLWGELYPRQEKQTRNPAETIENRYKIEILMSLRRKLKGLAAASLRLKTLDDNPYFSTIL